MSVKIVFRPIQHDPMEIIMGQAIWFKPIGGVNAISATANTNGFTPLTSIIRAYDWDKEIIEGATNECNLKGEVAIINHLQPKLLLVPKTRGQSNTLFYITDLLHACAHLKVSTLHFTHYGFIQNRLPSSEIEEILKVMQSPANEVVVKNVIWDIDVRQDKNLEYLYQVTQEYGLQLEKNS